MSADFSQHYTSKIGPAVIEYKLDRDKIVILNAGDVASALDMSVALDDGAQVNALLLTNVINDIFEQDQRMHDRTKVALQTMMNIIYLGYDEV
jgi:hypothetical protein